MGVSLLAVAKSRYYYYLLLNITNKTQPNLHSEDTSIQETLTLVPTLSPE